MLLVGRYKITEEIKEEDSQATILGLPIKLFRCIDQLTRQNVIVSAIPFPQDHRLQELAIDIWEQDIRLSRKALSMTNGQSLLKLLDARLDESNSLLISVLEYYDDTLEGILSSESKNSLFHKEINARRKFWEMFLQIVQGLDALHESGLFHRNISPKSIYITDDEKIPLRLGNFSWGVYLHSLVRIVIRKEIALRKRAWDIYCAPEIVPGKLVDIQKKVGETFSSDLFSMGMVIAHCLLHEFPTDDPTDWNIRYELVNEIREEIRTSDVFIFDEERTLLLSLTSINKTNRPSSTKNVIELINGVLNNLIRDEEFEIQEKLPVSFDKRHGSYFWKNLERAIDRDLTEISNNLDQFLEKEFKDSFVYPTLDKAFPLCIVSSNNICYQFKPKFNTRFNKENFTVADLRIPPFYFQEKILKTIRSVKPLALLKNGVYKTDTPYTDYSTSKWGRLFVNARSLIAEKSFDPSADVSNFIDRLFLILDAQKELESKKILNYQFEGHKKIKSKDKDRIIVEIMAGNDHFKKLDLLSYLREVRDKSVGKVELSLESSPYAEFDKTQTWEMVSVNQRNNEVILQRKKTKRGRDAPLKGYMRPLELSLGVYLHKRKKWGIIDLKENRGLLDILLYPRSSLLNLGLPETYLDPLLARIHNNLPFLFAELKLIFSKNPYNNEIRNYYVLSLRNLITSEIIDQQSRLQFLNDLKNQINSCNETEFHYAFCLFILCCGYLKKEISEAERLRYQEELSDLVLSEHASKEIIELYDRSMNSNN